MKKFVGDTLYYISIYDGVLYVKKFVEGVADPPNT